MTLASTAVGGSGPSSTSQQNHYCVFMQIRSDQSSMIGLMQTYRWDQSNSIGSITTHPSLLQTIRNYLLCHAHSFVFYYTIRILLYYTHSKPASTKFFSVSKTTRPLRLIWYNFTNSQHLLIIFDSILNWNFESFKTGLEPAAQFQQQQ